MTIKKYKLYLIDLDGTIYQGNNKIDYAKEFVDYLNSNNIDYLFLTNNSTKTKAEVVEKLKTFDIETTENNVFTSSDATKMYVEEKGFKTAYVIGERGIKTTLEGTISLLNSSDVDAVIVGLDRELTYKKLETACRAILKGAHFIGTNPDTLLPTETGFSPSNGGQIKYLEFATSTKAQIIGKPSEIIMECAMKLFNYNKSDIVMVGDNYSTDIMSGINAKVDTIHVRTGVTSFEELKLKDVQPTYSIENLSKLID